MKDEQCYISNKCTVQDAYVILNGKNKQIQKECEEDDEEEKTEQKRRREMIEVETTVWKGYNTIRRWGVVWCGAVHLS